MRVALTLWVGDRETGRPLSATRLSWHSDGVRDVEVLTGLAFGFGGSFEPFEVSWALMRQAPGDRRLSELRVLVREAIDRNGQICYG